MTTPGAHVSRADQDPKLRLMAIRAAIDCEKINSAAQVGPQAVAMLAPIEKKPFMSIEKFRTLPLEERIRVLRDKTTRQDDELEREQRREKMAQG